MNRRHLLIGGAGLAVSAVGVGLVSMAGMGSSQTAAEAARRARAPIRPPARDLDLVRHATLAANGHNTQPWRFRIRDEQIEILPDFSRRTSAVDPDDHHLFVSLGCAAENLALAAAAAGSGGELSLRPNGSVAFKKGAAAGQEAALASAIPHRQSTRSEYDGRPIATADLLALERAAAVAGVETVLVTDRPRMSALRDLVIEGNSRQMADPAFMRELKQWIRFSPAEAVKTGDGLYAAASGNPSVPDWLGKIMFDKVVTADGENEKYSKQLASSAGLAVFVAARPDPQGWLAVGRACQRFMLQATTLGIRCAFVNQPVEVPGLRPALASLAGSPGERPDLLVRFGRGPVLPYSLRRPVDAVVV